MSSKIITTIVKEKIPCLFISPHLDDAILSAGSLMQFLSSHTSVTLISIFTKPSPAPYPLLTRRVMKKCGFTDANALFATRRKEDRQVCMMLKISYQHLGFVDGAWRMKNHSPFFLKYIGKIIPELTHLYPLTLNTKKIHRQDVILMKKIYTKLLACVKKYSQKKCVVFFPLAIGNHIDHVITNNICKKLPIVEKICWEDYPYVLTARAGKDTSSFRFTKAQKEKAALLAMYSSQMSLLFPKKKITKIPECYTVLS